VTLASDPFADFNNRFQLKLKQANDQSIRSWLPPDFEAKFLSAYEAKFPRETPQAKRKKRKRPSRAAKGSSSRGKVFRKRKRPDPLRELARAGAKPRIVVDAIIDVAGAFVTLPHPNVVTTAKSDLKQLEKQFLDLANGLKQFGGKAEDTVLNPESNARFWGLLLGCGQKDLAVFYEQWTEAHRRNKEIKAQVRYFRAQAKSINSISKRWEYEKKFSWMNPLYRLIRYVWQTTKKPHDPCVAKLLLAACGVLGIEASTIPVRLTTDGIKKFRRHHCPDLIAKKKGQHPPKS
jgi:hypothetical protein